MNHLLRDIHSIAEDLSDMRLAQEEFNQLTVSIEKIKKGDTSDFVPLEAARRELGL